MYGDAAAIAYRHPGATVNSRGSIIVTDKRISSAI